MDMCMQGCVSQTLKRHSPITVSKSGHENPKFGSSNPTQIYEVSVAAQKRSQSHFKVQYNLSVLAPIMFNMLMCAAKLMFHVFTSNISFVCLLFYVLATFNIISGWTSTCDDSAHT